MNGTATLASQITFGRQRHLQGILPPSTKVLAKGPRDFGERLKKQAEGRLVHIVTDDCDIALGYLLRNNSREVRVGVCVGFIRDNFEFERRQQWQVVAVDAQRIKEITYRN